jgi:methionine synthase I (cobalamin-dependent)
LDFPALVANAPVLTDGAWGTELQARGLPAGQCPDAWNVSNPDAVAAVAASYVAAGSDVVLTNTFRSNALSLAAVGLAGQVVEINRQGAAISRRAAEGRALVFGSMGPVGELVSISGELSKRAESAFVQQAQALADGGVDALLIETFSDVEEAKLALAAALGTGLPVVVSFAFDTGRNRDRTMTGATPEQVAAAMTAEGASAIGANCGNGVDQVAALCARLRASTHLPLWLKPNAGLPVLSGGKIIYDMQPDEFASQIPALLQAGATFVGACCGSGPAFIAAAATRLQRARARQYLQGADHAYQGD